MTEVYIKYNLNKPGRWRGGGGGGGGGGAGLVVRFYSQNKNFLLQNQA